MRNMKNGTFPIEYFEHDKELNSIETRDMTGAEVLGSKYYTLKGYYGITHLIGN